MRLLLALSSLLLFSVACKGDDETKAEGLNPNKIVVGGSNVNPQMGLFVLSAVDAKRVDTTRNTDPKAAYELAEQLAVKKFAGDRNFCEDAVRMTIGFMGIDGMLGAEDLERWKSADFEEMRKKHMTSINELHEQMIGESAPKKCERTLQGFVENMRFAAEGSLELRNFGY